MASLQELRKRLRTIQSTGQLAGAMRTAATAKYARLSRVREDFMPYARACREMLSLLGDIGLSREEGKPAAERDCLVVLCGNRGLCGGFNAELLRYLDAHLPEVREPLILACGKKAAAYLKEHDIPFEDYTVSDVPSFQEVKPLADRLRNAFTQGEVSRVLVMYQHFRNTLVQIPTMTQLLPGGEEEDESAGEESTLLLLPDRETIGAQLAMNCLDAQVFELALESASGAQAATLMAMRSACDNAEEYAANLEITINRRRQADVTSSVIETASGNVQQGD